MLTEEIFDRPSTAKTQAHFHRPTAKKSTTNQRYVISIDG